MSQHTCSACGNRHLVIQHLGLVLSSSWSLSAGPSADVHEDVGGAGGHAETSGSEEGTSDDSEVSSLGADDDGGGAVHKQQAGLRVGQAPARQPMRAVPAQSGSDEDPESDNDGSEEEDDDVSEQQQRQRQRQQQQEPRVQKGVKRRLEPSATDSDSGNVSGGDGDSDGEEEGSGSEEDAAEGSSGREYADLHVEQVIR